MTHSKSHGWSRIRYLLILVESLQTWYLPHRCHFSSICSVTDKNVVWRVVKVNSSLLCEYDVCTHTRVYAISTLGKSVTLQFNRARTEKKQSLFHKHHPLSHTRAAVWLWGLDNKEDSKTKSFYSQWKNQSTWANSLFHCCWHCWEKWKENQSEDV
jgi:hypothetical protein